MAPPCPHCDLDPIPFLTPALSAALPRFHPPAGGHYLAYCQNVISGQWYEFDDQYVTEVHETVVQGAEAYVLFYRQAGCWGRRDQSQLGIEFGI